jgi:hypothetical protein
VTNHCISHSDDIGFRAYAQVPVPSEEEVKVLQVPAFGTGKAISCLFYHLDLRNSNVGIDRITMGQTLSNLKSESQASLQYKPNFQP